MARRTPASPSNPSPSWLKDPKVIAYVLAGLLTLASGVAAYFSNRVKIVTEEKTAVTAELAQAKRVSETAAVKALLAEQSSRRSESKYKKLLLATNPFTGDALFDKDGRPIFNEDEGTEEAIEHLTKQLTETREENRVLTETLVKKNTELSLRSTVTTKPAQSPWGFTVAGSGSSVQLVQGDVKAWGGAVYRMNVMSLPVGLGYELGGRFERDSAAFSADRLEHKFTVHLR